MDVTSTLKVEEGFSATVYQDHLGYYTIGYGHRCSASHRRITESEAEEILLNDIDTARKNIDTLVGKEAPQEVKDIVTVMVFQIGFTGVSEFKNTLAKIRLGDYKGAAKRMLRSKWKIQTPARAKRLAVLMSQVES